MARPCPARRICYPAPRMNASSPRETALKKRVAAAVGAELRAIDDMISAQIASPVGLVREIGGFIAGLVLIKLFDIGRARPQYG